MAGAQPLIPADRSKSIEGDAKTKLYSENDEVRYKKASKKNLTAASG